MSSFDLKAVVLNGTRPRRERTYCHLFEYGKIVGLHDPQPKCKELAFGHAILGDHGLYLVLWKIHTYVLVVNGKAEKAFLDGGKSESIKLKWDSPKWEASLDVSFYSGEFVLTAMLETVKERWLAAVSYGVSEFKLAKLLKNKYQ